MHAQTAILISNNQTEWKQRVFKKGSEKMMIKNFLSYPLLCCFSQQQRRPTQSPKNQCNTRRGFLALPGFLQLFVKLNFCIRCMQWDVDLTLPCLAIQMKIHIIMTRKHFQIAQPLLLRMWWDIFCYL